ncbi:hypothetical protein BDR04DRAFT_1093069, partial [Suillus decipiens]
MSTMETENTSFKTVFLINLMVNKLKEANLTIAPPSAEDYITYLCAVLAIHGIRSPKKKTYGFKYIYL